MKSSSMIRRLLEQNKNDKGTAVSPVRYINGPTNGRKKVIRVSDIRRIKTHAIWSSIRILFIPFGAHDK